MKGLNELVLKQVRIAEGHFKPDYTLVFMES